MGIFSGIFGGGSRRSPAAAANPYLQQIGPMAQERLDPYINRGKDAAGLLDTEYRGLVENPADAINKLMMGYSESEGFKSAYDRALKALQNTSAATGTLGTEADQYRTADLARQLASQGQYDWLDRVLGMYRTGIEGEQGFYNQGYGANQDLTSILGNVLSTQGGLAFQGAQQRNQNRNDLFRSILQGAGAVAGGAMGGGYW